MWKLKGKIYLLRRRHCVRNLLDLAVELSKFEKGGIVSFAIDEKTFKKRIAESENYEGFFEKKNFFGLKEFAMKDLKNNNFRN